MHRRQSRVQREGIDLEPIVEQEPIDYDIKRIRATLELLEGWRDILRSANVRCADLKSELFGCCLDLIHLERAGRVRNVDHNRKSTEIGNNIAQKLKSLANQIG